MATVTVAMVKALNAQVGRELQASHNYLAMAVYLEGRSLEYLAAFFHRQSDEERAHAMKLVAYLQEVGQTPAIPALTRPKARYTSVADVFKTSLKQEQAVTRAIHELVDTAQGKKDYATFQFLQWFVTEQVEEESSFAKLIDVIEMSKNNVLQVEHYVRHMMGVEADSGSDAEG
jgi:ferritin